MGRDGTFGERLTRRGLLRGSAALAGGLALAPQVGTAPAAHANGLTFDERVAELRAKFFSGPIVDRIDLESLDPSRRPDSTEIGTIAHFQFVDEFPLMTPENLLPYVVAAGVKWLRTGFEYKHWDWSTNQPSELLKKWVEADLEVGVKPLFTVNNSANIGTPIEVSGWVDMVRGAIGKWGVDVGAFMFDNEPGNGMWKDHYGGGFSGGPWVKEYARFVEEGSRQIKADYPNAMLINGVQVEQVAITQLKQSSPSIDALCEHHYAWHQSLPPEYGARAGNSVYPDFATSDPEFERAMSDYVRQGRMLQGNPDLQLWMTETGTASASPREFPPDTLEPLSPSQQAKSVARLLVLGSLATTKTFIYALVDPRWVVRPNRSDSGLVSDDLTTPKPAYFVLGRISALTGGRATPDPEFRADVTLLTGRSLPSYVKRIENTLVREDLRAERFNTASGRPLVAVWSTHPPREDFEPRRATFAVNKPLGRRPVVVDPMTGASRFLATRPGPGGTELFELDVHDYPQFIVAEV